MSWWIIAVLCAYFIKGLCGFANTLVFTTILSFGNSNISITPIELLVGYPTNIIMAWKERKSVRLNICVPLTILVLLGNIPGILLLKNVNSQIIKIIFGFIIILIGIEMIVRENKVKKKQESKFVLGIIGVVSGILCGLYGIGALLAAYVSRVTDDIKSFKANLCLVFIVENTFRVIVYSFIGIITIDILRQVVVLIPFMLIGLFLGMKSSSFADEKSIKRIVIIMLMFSGAALIVNNL